VVAFSADGDRSPEQAADVALLTPDRYVRYLRRPISEGFARELGHFLFSAASEFHPEQLPAFFDNRAGLTVSIMSSTDSRVGIEVSIIVDLEAQVAETDGINFETSRTALASAGLALGGGATDSGLTDGV